MILLDTHIWIWWAHQRAELPASMRALLAAAGSAGIGVSVVSCWELCQLVERGRVNLALPVEQWLKLALTHPAVSLLPLTPEICVEASRLPGNFHKDPADRLLVGTARVHGCPMMTVDGKIRGYPHVKLV